MSGSMGWAALAGVTLGVGLWALLSMVPRFGRARLLDRVAPYLVDVSAAARDRVARQPANPLPVFGVILEPVAQRLRLIHGPSSTQTRLRLSQAGSALTVEEHRMRLLAWAVGGAVVGVVVAALIARTQSPPVVVSVVLVVVCAVGGYLAREWLLQRAAQRRVARIVAQLPTMLEFLTLSLSAGEGVLDSLRRVARTARGDFAEELADVVADVNAGIPLAHALVALSRRLQVPALDRAVDQLVAALERGTPLAEVLRAQAQDAREHSKRDLIEVAGKKEVAMLVPLVFLILPVTILFAVFPGVFVLQLGF